MFTRRQKYINHIIWMNLRIWLLIFDFFSHFLNYLGAFFSVTTITTHSENLSCNFIKIFLRFILFMGRSRSAYFYIHISICGNIGFACCFLFFRKEKRVVQNKFVADKTIMTIQTKRRNGHSSNSVYCHLFISDSWWVFHSSEHINLLKINVFILFSAIPILPELWI